MADLSSTIALDCEPGHVDGILVHSGHLTSVRQLGEETSASAKSTVDQLVSMGRLQSPENARLLIYGSDAASLESGITSTCP